MTILLPPSRNEFVRLAFAHCRQWRNSPKWIRLYVKFYGVTPNADKAGNNTKLGKNGQIGNRNGANDCPNYTPVTALYGRKSPESVQSRYSYAGQTHARHEMDYKD